MKLENKGIFFNEKIMFCGLVALIFDNIPRLFQLNTLSGGMSSKLSWYFFFYIFIGFAYKSLKKEIKFDGSDLNYLRYLGFLFIFILVSNIAGLIRYPYYQELLNGPINQIEKLPVVIKFFHKVGIALSVKTATMVWLSVRVIKNSLLSYIYSFGFSFAIYKLFKTRWEKFFTMIQKAVFISVMMMSLYSVIELFFLAGNTTAEWMLTVINPFLHSIAIDHNWWPPLLWKGQLRSVFAEPSRMGNYAAFALPFLWERVLKRGGKWPGIALLTFFYTFLIFMTRARTAVSVYWGIFLLMIVFVIIFKEKKFISRIVSIVCITIIALGASIGFNNFFMKNNRPEESFATFMESNLGSLASQNKRSNGARYALIRANIKTGMEHPILGVGDILGTAYTVHNFNEYDLNNKEVAMWVKDYKQQGVLKYGLDAMNEYVSRFAQNGSVGLLLFLLPAFYGAVKLLQQIKAEPVPDRKMKEITSLLALIGTSVAGCNGSLTLLYTYWVILALVYAVIYKGESSMKDKV